MNDDNKLMIPKGHPNRPGLKLLSLKAIIVHYTANDRPGADDVANAEYFARPYKYNGKLNVFLEEDGKTLFQYGSAHIIADMDSITECIPTDEVAYHAGKGYAAWDSINKGFAPAGRMIFRFRPNFYSIGVEICNNADWKKAVSNAQNWIINYFREQGLKMNFEQSIDCDHYYGVAPEEIVVLRHFDVCRKDCPDPFVKNVNAWHEFLTDIKERVA